MREQASWDNHARFMDDLTTKGFIFPGGPLTNSREFLVVIKADGEQDVRSTFARDL